MEISLTSLLCSYYITLLRNLGRCTSACQTYIVVSTFQVAHDRHISDVVLLGLKYRSQTADQQRTSKPKSLPLSYSAFSAKKLYDLSMANGKTSMQLLP